VSGARAIGCTNLHTRQIAAPVVTQGNLALSQVVVALNWLAGDNVGTLQLVLWRRLRRGISELYRRAQLFHKAQHAISTLSPLSTIPPPWTNWCNGLNNRDNGAAAGYVPSVP